jgi:NAD(P)H-hydrate epimerase
MRSIDSQTIESLGIPGLVLMERAGLAAVDAVQSMRHGRRVLVLAGTGNNGGDGLVVARELYNRGVKVSAMVLGRRGRMSPACAHQYDVCRKLGVPVHFGQSITPADLHGALVVDAIFGTGLAKEIAGPSARIIAAVNSSDCPVVAVDIPSGISSDTGQILGVAMRADITVTFGIPKIGHYLLPGAEYTGRLVVSDIGFPPSLYDKATCSLIAEEDARLLLPHRHANSHKGANGHILLVAGSLGKVGAAFLSSRAALRAGAGLVTVAGPDALAGVYQAKALEEMVLPLDDAGQGFLAGPEAVRQVLGFAYSDADVLAIGPGLGRADATVQAVREIVASCAAPMVMDADALYALSGDDREAKRIWGRLRAPAVLTPHPGEFARLTGLTVPEIEADRVRAAVAYSASTGAYLVLKGSPTIVATPDGDAFINSSGGPGLATAGTGDVLTGVIAAMLAQGLSPLEAALLGVYVHGAAGDHASARFGAHGLIASDVAEALPGVLASLADSPLKGVSI